MIKLVLYAAEFKDDVIKRIADFFIKRMQKQPLLAAVFLHGKL